MIWTVSLWLGSKGKERIQANLSAAEQHEFWNLLKKSRGRSAPSPSGIAHG